MSDLPATASRVDQRVVKEIVNGVAAETGEAVTFENRLVLVSGRVIGLLIFS
jgi:hypothetical protein